MQSIYHLKGRWETGKSHSEHCAKAGHRIAKDPSTEGLQLGPVVYPEEAPWRLMCPRVNPSLLELKRTGKKTVDLGAFSNLIN